MFHCYFFKQLYRLKRPSPFCPPAEKKIILWLPPTQERYWYFAPFEDACDFVVIVTILPIARPPTGQINNVTRYGRRVSIYPSHYLSFYAFYSVYFFSCPQHVKPFPTGDPSKSRRNNDVSSPLFADRRPPLGPTTCAGQSISRSSQRPALAVCFECFPDVIHVSTASRSSVFAYRLSAR